MSKPTPTAKKGKEAPAPVRRNVEPATIEVHTNVLLALIWMAAPDLLLFRYRHAPADLSGVLPSPGQTSELLLKYLRKRAESEAVECLTKLSKGTKEEIACAFTSSHPVPELIWLANFASKEASK